MSENEMLRDIYKFKKETISDKAWVFPFGKNQGESLQDVLDTDPDYVLWMAENTDLDFHADIIDEAEGSNDV